MTDEEYEEAKREQATTLRRALQNGQQGQKNKARRKAILGDMAERLGVSRKELLDVLRNLQEQE